MEGSLPAEVSFYLYLWKLALCNVRHNETDILFLDGDRLPEANYSHSQIIKSTAPSLSHTHTHTHTHTEVENSVCLKSAPSVIQCIVTSFFFSMAPKRQRAHTRMLAKLSGASPFFSRNSISVLQLMLDVMYCDRSNYSYSITPTSLTSLWSSTNVL